MKKMKIALLGGGSLYFEYVMAEIANTPELEAVEFMLFDVNVKRMDLMRRVGLRIMAKANTPHVVKATTHLARALDGADFAIASIGVHGPGSGWHLIDSNTAAKCGIIHTTGDTVGPAGLSQGLRIIPIMVDIAKNMEKYCPEAILLNHSNPMAPICRAITKYSSIRPIGYCHNVYNDISYLADVLGIKPADLDVTVGGINHCGWLLGIRHGGRDRYPELKRRLALRKPPTSQLFSQELFQTMGLYPIGGSRHLIEFFPHARTISSTRRLPYRLPWRSDTIRKNLLQLEINKDPTGLVLKAAGKKDVWAPTTMTPEAMGRQVKALSLGPSMIHIVNIPNRGAIPNLPDWAVVEVKAVVGQDGAQSVYAGELPPQAARWTLAQIYAHELTIEAAIEKNRAKAIQALASDPMIRDFKEANKVFDAIVKAQGARLRAFRKSRHRE